MSLNDQITKAEILAMLEVQNKTATQLESIATSLSTLAKDQKDISDCVSNCKGVKEKINIIKDDVLMLKILYGSIGLVTALAIVILKILETFH